MFKYLKFLVPKPLYIWYWQKHGYFLAIHNPLSFGWFQYLKDSNYIYMHEGKDPNHINTNMEGDTKIGDFVKSGHTLSRRRNYVKSLPDRTFSVLRDVAHGRETIEPE